MSASKAIGHTNTLLRFKKPDFFSQGVAARLPEAYRKFYDEWKCQTPSPVHYIPEPGKWKRDPETGVVSPVQNIPLPLKHPDESHKGLWGGEAVVKGFQKRHPLRRRVPHYWFPTLHRSVVYSEVLNKHMSMVVTQRALNLIHQNYGFDHYLLKTPACDIQSLLALKIKRKILMSLWKKDLYPEDEEKREDVYNTYKGYLAKYTEEDIDWYGLSFFEAIKKQMELEKEKTELVPLKVVYRAQLVEKLKAAGIEEVTSALKESGITDDQKSTSWLSKMNPFSSRKQE